jgi:hypothetical protein
LNNKSINYTNKNSLLHKSLKNLTQKKPNNLNNIKSNKIKTKIRDITNNNNNTKMKENYEFKRRSYYKKNLTRIKLFYGYDKK